MAVKPDDGDPDPMQDEFKEADPVFEGIEPSWSVGLKANPAGWVEIVQADGQATRIAVAAVAYYSAGPRGTTGTINLISGATLSVELGDGILELDDLFQTAQTAPPIEPDEIMAEVDGKPAPGQRPAKGRRDG